MSRTSVSIRGRAGRAEQLDLLGRQVGLGDDPGPDGVVDVVVDVGDAVDQPDDPALERRRLQRAGVVEDPVADLLGQVEARARRARAARRPAASARCGGSRCRRAPSAPSSSDLLADVAEGRVAEVVAEPDRLGQVLVQAERAGDGAGDEAGLERVGEAGPVVVALGSDEDLGLVLEPPERLRVDDPVAVALKRRADRAVGLGLGAGARDRSGWRAPRGTPPPGRGCAWPRSVGSGGRSSSSGRRRGGCTWAWCARVSPMARSTWRSGSSRRVAAARRSGCRAPRP